MRRTFVILCAALMMSGASLASAQTPQIPALNLAGTPATAVAATADEGVAQFRPRPVSNALPKFGVGIKAGTLGIGVQIGTALASRVNLRGGANFFNYSDSFGEHGVNYQATLQLRSVEAKLDLFAIGGFRFTPGLLLYNNNNATATASATSGQSFTLGGVQYFSNPASPVTGTATLALNKFAPTLGIGFGNLLPRSARHWSLSADLGVVFQGEPQFTLGLAGQVCAPTPGANCQSVNNPSVQPNVTAEQAKVQSDLKPFKYYPEASIMLGWKF